MKMHTVKSPGKVNRVGKKVGRGGRKFSLKADNGEIMGKGTEGSKAKGGRKRG
jgi:hypothetical protein